MMPASVAALIESLDRHFLTGCPSLSASQLRAHQQRGTCRECRHRAIAERQRAAKIRARELAASP